MGRASRWLRGLLGGKRAATGGDTKPATFTEKRRWGFVRSFREKENTVAAPAIYRDHGAAVDEEAQSKRAIAVAAATAAVAEAAVAAAQAAAAVVRLTSSGRSGGLGFGGVKKDEGAAVKIQAAFRGYLARRALRALRGLVKLQALVRGNIVRKQAAETLRCMQALVRVQARARACRALRSERQSSKHIKSKPSRSHPGPPTPEKYEHAIRAKSDRSCSLKRNSSKPVTTDSASSDRAQSSGWNWLDRWMEERYWDSREAATKSSGATADDEKNAKILEIDTGKPPPQLNPKRRGSNHANHHQYSSCSTLTSDRNSRSFATVVDSPSKDSSVDMPHPSSPLRFPIVDGGDVVDSPQFYSASSRPGSSRRGPFTPAKSECSRSVFSGYSDYPNYMANTESSKAKVRSQSAPRQRREFEKSGSLRRASAGANGFARDPSWTAAAAPAAAQRPTSLQTKFANKAYPGSGRLDRLGMPIRYQ